MADRFTIERGRWYGWQMLPGYFDGYRPYFSPIYVEGVRPHKTSEHRLELAFYNAFYAEGVRWSRPTLTVLHRFESYLIARPMHTPSHWERTIIISEMSFDWLRSCTRMLDQTPPTPDLDVQAYLTATLLDAAD
jgi:hypothetical protein